MKKTYIIIAIVILAIIGILYYRFGGVQSLATENDSVSMDGTSSSTSPTGSIPSSNNSVTTPAPLKNSITYANKQYGFSITYPKAVVANENFRLFYNLGNNWRVNAVAPYQGTSLISFIVHQENNDVPNNKKYPLFFTTEVRVSVTKDTKNCYVKDAGYADQKVTNVTIGGVAWKRFDFQDAAMMKYLEGQSYRTVRNNTCYVVERVKAGSIYRDETMSTQSTDAQLANYYSQTQSIVNSFVFTQ